MSQKTIQMMIQKSLNALPGGMNMNQKLPKYRTIRGQVKLTRYINAHFGHKSQFNRKFSVTNGLFTSKVERRRERQNYFLRNPVTLKAFHLRITRIFITYLRCQMKMFLLLSIDRNRSNCMKIIRRIQGRDFHRKRLSRFGTIVSRKLTRPNSSDHF